MSARSVSIRCWTGGSRWESRGCRSLERWDPTSSVPIFCSCVGVSLLPAPRANKKRNRLSRQHGRHSHTPTHKVMYAVCKEYVTVCSVSVCRLELRNLSRLQSGLSGILKLAACHNLYLNSTLVSQLVSYFNKDFGNDVPEHPWSYIEIILMWLVAIRLGEKQTACNTIRIQKKGNCISLQLHEKDRLLIHLFFFNSACELICSYISVCELSCMY